MSASRDRAAVEERRQRAFALLGAGRSHREIALELGIAKGVVSNIIARQREREAKAAPSAAVSATPPAVHLVVSSRPSFGDYAGGRASAVFAGRGCDACRCIVGCSCGAGAERRLDPAEVAVTPPVLDLPAFRRRPVIAPNPYTRRRAQAA